MENARRLQITPETCKKGLNVCRTCSAARVRVDSSCILSSELSKTPESAGRLGTGCLLKHTTIQTTRFTLIRKFKKKDGSQEQP